MTNNTSASLRAELTLTNNTDPGVVIPPNPQQQTIGSERWATFRVNVNPADQPDQIEVSLKAVDAETSDLSVSLSRPTTVETVDPCAGPRRVTDGKTQEAIDEDKTVVLSQGINVTDGIDTDRCAILRPNAEVNGNVDLGANILRGKNTTIAGDVDPNGQVS